MTDKVAFEELLTRYREAFNKVRDEITTAAIAEGRLDPREVCVVLGMAGVNITAFAIVAGRLSIKDWDGELAHAVHLKRLNAATDGRLQ